MIGQTKRKVSTWLYHLYSNRGPIGKASIVMKSNQQVIVKGRQASCDFHRSSDCTLNAKFLLNVYNNS
jgi:hypothetical protein